MIGMSFLYYVRDIFFRQSLLSILKASDMETTGMRLPLRHCLFTWMAWLLYTYRVTQYVRTHIHVVIELALTKNAKPSTYYWFLHFKRKVPIKNRKKWSHLRCKNKKISVALTSSIFDGGPYFYNDICTNGARHKMRHSTQSCETSNKNGEAPSSLSLMAVSQKNSWNMNHFQTSNWDM